MADIESCIEKDTAQTNVLRVVLCGTQADGTVALVLCDAAGNLLVHNTAADSIDVGVKTCDTSAARLKSESLANTESLTIKVRSMGDASYIAIGGSGSQDFRLTAEGDSVDLDVDPYAVYVKDDHSSTAAVVEYLARVSA